MGSTPTLPAHFFIMKKYLLEVTQDLKHFASHEDLVKELALILANWNGTNIKGLELDIPDIFTNTDTGIGKGGFTGKWLGNTIYEFSHKKINRVKPVVYGRIFIINL